MKLITVVGARPQFIKASVVSRRLRACPDVREVLVHTGQHFDAAMSEVFFAELELPPPHYHLGIGPGSHGAQTGRMLEALDALLQTERPARVLVYGDTNSTLAGALAAAKLHLPVAHIEAGLRSFNRAMPEEINRVMTDHLADLLFAPTPTAVNNLVREGIAADIIHKVGDVMYDVAVNCREKAERNSGLLERLELSSKRYILATIHRAENTDDTARLQAIFGGLAMAAREVPVVLPLHPRTRNALARHDLRGAASRRLRLIEPVGYLDMLTLIMHARLVATDSGGLQKEAFFHRVPCVTLRSETEWVELVEAGWNRLCPPLDTSAIAAGVLDALDCIGRPVTLYGDGKAAAAIVDILTAL